MLDFTPPPKLWVPEKPALIRAAPNDDLYRASGLLNVLASYSSAPPAFVASGTALSHSLSPRTFTLPTGWAVGQVAICFINQAWGGFGSTGITLPTGWTNIASVSDGVSYSAHTIKRVLVSGDTGVTVSDTSSNATYLGGYIGTFKNAGGSTESVLTSGGSSGSTTPAYLRPTSTGANRLAIATWGIVGDASQTSTSPWNERADNDIQGFTNHTVGIEDDLLATASQVAAANKTISAIANVTQVAFILW